MLINKERFLSIVPRVVEVEVPALGGSVFVKQFSCSDKDRFEADHVAAGVENFRARLAAATVCDQDGVLIFGKEDVPRLAAMPAAVLDVVVKASLAANGLVEGEFDDQKKGSETTTS